MDICGDYLIYLNEQDQSRAAQTHAHCYFNAHCKRRGTLPFYSRLDMKGENDWLLYDKQRFCNQS